MSVYIVDSKKSWSLAQYFSFPKREYRCIHLKGKQIDIIKIGYCHLLEKLKFSLVGLGVSVCMSMSVWSEKKKEETKNIHIHSHIHTQLNLLYFYQHCRAYQFKESTQSFCKYFLGKIKDKIRDIEKPNSEVF
jgi:hypothetical protein